MAPRTRKRTKADADVENTENVVPSEPKSKKENLSKALENAGESQEFVGQIDPDSHFPESNCHVFVQEDGTVYDATLNQTNLGNNNNKFYICQILKHDTSDTYFVWFRWGRVGYDGQNSCQQYPDSSYAKREFEKKFKDKTGNTFSDRASFVKKNGKYDLIQIDYGKKKLPPVVQGVQETVEVDSKLDERLKKAIDLICNLKAMATYLKHRNYDSDRTPLGALSKKQIKAGFEALTRIERKILDGDFGDEYKELLDAYLTKIPHSFGAKRVPFLKTLDDLKTELELLETLADANLASDVLGEEEKRITKIHPSDSNYQKLKCEIIPLEEKHADYKVVKSYLQNTHGKTHSNFKVNLLNVFKIGRQNEKDKFRSDLLNQRLLFHGSGLPNWCGILLMGLRIAPAEAPCTGYMFGKGIYFANSVSKSANYCRARVGERAFLTLAQVALGNMQERTECDYEASKLPTDIHSTHGVGMNEPAKRGSKKIEIDGQEVFVPCGRLTEKKDFKSDLIYDEFIVYNTNQVCLRYLVEVEFAANDSD